MRSEGIGFRGNLFLYEGILRYGILRYGIFGVVWGCCGNCAWKGFGYKKRRKNIYGIYVKSDRFSASYER